MLPSHSYWWIANRDHYIFNTFYYIYLSENSMATTGDTYRLESVGIITPYWWLYVVGHLRRNSMIVEREVPRAITSLKVS